MVANEHACHDQLQLRCSNMQTHCVWHFFHFFPCQLGSKLRPPKGGACDFFCPGSGSFFEPQGVDACESATPEEEWHDVFICLETILSTKLIFVMQHVSCIPKLSTTKEIGDTESEEQTLWP